MGSSVEHSHTSLLICKQGIDMTCFCLKDYSCGVGRASTSDDRERRKTLTKEIWQRQLYHILAFMCVLLNYILIIYAYIAELICVHVYKCFRCVQPMACGIHVGKQSYACGPTQNSKIA